MLQAGCQLWRVLYTIFYLVLLSLLGPYWLNRIFIYLVLQLHIMPGMPPQKHVIESGITTVASTAQTFFTLAKGTINPDPFSDATQCRVGSILGALTIELDVTGSPASTSDAVQYFDWFLFYNIDDSQTAPTADNVMGSAGKDLINQVFHQDGCLISYSPATGGTRSTGYETHSWRTTISIPQTYRKILRGDTIKLYYKMSTATNATLKLRVIYKEYFP